MPPTVEFVLLAAAGASKRSLQKKHAIQDAADDEDGAPNDDEEAVTRVERDPEENEEDPCERHGYPIPSCRRARRMPRILSSPAGPLTSGSGSRSACTRR